MKHESQVVLHRYNNDKSKAVLIVIDTDIILIDVNISSAEVCLRTKLSMDVFGATSVPDPYILLNNMTVLNCYIR